MANPTWVTTAGSIPFELANTQANGEIGSNLLYPYTMSNIAEGQLVFGVGINPDTRVSGINIATRTASITSAQGNGYIATYTFNTYPYIPFALGDSVNVTGVTANLNVGSNIYTVSSAFNGTFNVISSGANYVSVINTDVTTITSLSTPVTISNGNANIAINGSYIQYANANSVISFYGANVGNITNSTTYYINSVNTIANTFTIKQYRGPLSCTASINASTSNISVASLVGLRVGQLVTFTGNTVGNISNTTNYWISSISNPNVEVSSTVDLGNTVVANSTGVMTLVTNDLQVTPTASGSTTVIFEGVSNSSVTVTTLGGVITGGQANVAILSKPLVANASGYYSFNITDFEEQSSINLAFTATASNSNNYVTYSKLNGTYPTGNLVLTSTANTGYLTGALSKVAESVTSNFTLRATEYTTSGNLVGVSDRSFDLTVVGRDIPKFLTVVGVIGNESLLNSLNANSPAAVISSITTSGGAIVVNTGQYNLTNYGIANGAPVTIGGVTGTTAVNDLLFYAGNANSSISEFKLYQDKNLTTLATVSFQTYTGGGTVSPVTIDSSYFSAQIKSDPVDPGLTVTYSIANGQLPPGLEMSSSGNITGYPTPPTVSNTIVLSQLYKFDVKISTINGSNTATYSIPVLNQEKYWIDNNGSAVFPGRPPVILNNKPLSATINISDPYYTYYVSGNSIGTFDQDNNLLFKMIGYNFNAPTNKSTEFGITYTIQGLTAGNTVNNAFSSIISPNLVSNIAGNGWINGTLQSVANTNLDIKTYNFTVTANVANANVGQPALTSGAIPFSLTISGLVDPTIIWNSDRVLGVINTGEVSLLSVSASFDQDITDPTYRVVGGNFPPNLQLLSTGEISGRAAFQAADTVTATGTTTDYIFTVEAYSPRYLSSGVTSTKEFKISLYQKFSLPYDNLYVSGMLAPQQRNEVDYLLSDLRSTQAGNIYRINDPYFGVASDVKYGHLYGVNSVLGNDFYTVYKSNIEKNYYYKNLTLGEMQTAVARDINDNILYEVVYSPIIDDLENSNGVSVSKSIAWPFPIIIDGVTQDRTVYPNSLDNMREQIEDTIGNINDSSLLPLWMISRQLTGNVPGYTACWIICYTKPGKSTTVKNWISSYMTDRVMFLNDITFGMDKFEVDRSMTYVWGSTETSGWPTYSASTISGNAIIRLDNIIGLSINQEVTFTNISNSNMNIRSTNKYYITEIDPRYLDGGTYYKTIKIRSLYYANSNSVITPDATATMTLLTTPLSASVNNDSKDQIIYITQQTILPAVD
jgi:hypothetical protein